MHEKFDLSSLLARLDERIAEMKQAQVDSTPYLIRTESSVPPGSTKLDTSRVERVADAGEASRAVGQEAIRSFIDSNGQSVSAALEALVQEKKIIMVGEVHTAECSHLRREVISALPALQRNGLTHVALETDSVYQEYVDSIDYSSEDSKIMENLQAKRIGYGWDGYTYGILLQAKRLGLKVVLLDFHDEAAEQTQDYARTQNIRDAHMAQTLIPTLDETSKVLIYIGTDHVERMDNAIVTRLRTHLSNAYGADQIASIRNVSGDQSFDCTYNGVSPAQLFGTEGGTSMQTEDWADDGQITRRAVIVPDKGPLQGNRNTDYINLVR